MNTNIKNILQLFKTKTKTKIKLLKSFSKFSKEYSDKLKTQNFNLKPSTYIENIQDRIEQVFRSDANQIILKPSKFWASAITWVLMGGTGFGIVWLSVAKTDEIVIALGKLEPIGGVIDVQMPLEGIAKEILIKEGDTVRKGQVLIKLDSEATQAKYESLEKKLFINQQILDKLNLLMNEGAVSEVQYLQQKTVVEDIKSEIKTNLVLLRYQEIKAPENGIIFDLEPKSPGFVARTTQPVLKLVPTDNLQAKVEIDSRTIGFVQVGKKAELSIDSFPATDFGIINGKVNSIGSDALPPSPSEGKGYRFPAIIGLNEQYLQIKTGKKLPLKAGMSLSANIKLRKVTYLQLLLNKFGDRTNSLKSI